jgi:hypothetical protein
LEEFEVLISFLGNNKTYSLGEKRSYHDGKNLDGLAGEGNLTKIIRNFTVIGAILT